MPPGGAIAIREPETHFGFDAFLPVVFVDQPQLCEPMGATLGLDETPEDRLHDANLLEGQVLRIFDGLGPDLGASFAHDLQFELDGPPAFLVEQLDLDEVRVLLELHADQHEAEHDADVGGHLQPVVEFAEIHT